MGETRVVYITGGAQGIGKGVGAHLLRSGYAVAITDIDAEAGAECVSELGELGPVFFSAADAGNENETEAAIGEVITRFGRLDGVVNNAALSDPYHAPIEELTLDAWQHIIGTNLTGAFLTAKHAVPHLRRTGGSVVNIASTRAVQSEANTEAYTASKGGILALTHALAVSLGPEIRVNAISPGWIDVSRWQKRARREPVTLTERDHAQHPVGRVGRPEDIAAMAAFLLSKEAGFITGQNFVVDGGMTRKMIYED